jgi:hypothetical protein
LTSPPPPEPAAAAEKTGLRLKAEAEGHSVADTPAGSDAPSELVERMQAHVAELEARRQERERRFQRSPWSAFLFPFQPLTTLAILLMMAVFSGMDILMEVGTAEKKPAAAAPAPTEKSAAPAAPDAPAGTGKGEIRAGGQRRISTEDELGPGVGAVSFKPAPPMEVQEEVVGPAFAWSDWWQAYRNSGPYAPDRLDEQTGRYRTGGQDAAGEFLIPGLVALGLTGLLLRFFVAAYFFALQLHLIHETSNGLERFPRWPNPFDLVDSILLPIYHYLAAAALAFAPATFAFFLPFWLPNALLPLWLAAPFLLLGGMLYFPMALMCVAVRGDTQAVTPGVVLSALVKAGHHYLPALLAGLAWLATPILIGHYLAPRWEPWQAVLLEHGLRFTLLVVLMRALGLMHRRIAGRLNWNAFQPA